MTAGDLLKNEGVEVVEDKTKPKSLLTDATLLGYMETAGKDVEDEEARAAIKDCGLGTPATRDNIITTLIGRFYIVREKKKLIPTEKGLATYEIVKDKAIASPELTGGWEKQLLDMSLGKGDYGDFMQKIKAYSTELVGELSAVTGVSVKTQTQVQGEAMPNCPKCKSKKTRIFQSKTNPDASGISCTDKECGFVVWRKMFGKELTDSQLKTLAKNEQTKPINGFVSSKSGRVFVASVKLNAEYKTELVFDSTDKKKFKK
jgi:DNA topoisomerase-3